MRGSRPTSYVSCTRGLHTYIFTDAFIHAQANYQLSELVASDCYAEWIAIVATFTIDSFNHWQEHTYICTHV